ncbi:MAG: hypothetical protein JNL80_16530 [Phycisphaerae bacterium]|nr:hypothetical protein [Phycisphaerae bacterium]
MLIAIMALQMAPTADARSGNAGSQPGADASFQDPPPAPADSAAPSTPTQDPKVTSERGLVAEVLVTVAPERGPGVSTVAGNARGLRAKPDQPLSAPILVRVSQAKAPESAAPRYRIEFIGSVAGDYDLRDYLEFSDGSPATTLAPIPVRVVSHLPANHGSDLFTVPEPPFRLESHYRTIFIALALLWLSVPIVVLVRRALRRPTPPVFAPQVAEPTLADLLRPLVERAMRDGLSVREQGRLELLLLHFWRERLGMHDMSPSDTLAHLRRHAEAGELLRAVEGWLHARGAGAPQPTDDIGELLRPYQSMTLTGEPAPNGSGSLRSPPPRDGSVTSSTAIPNESGVASATRRASTLQENASAGASPGKETPQ